MKRYFFILTFIFFLNTSLTVRREVNINSSNPTTDYNKQLFTGHCDTREISLVLNQLPQKQAAYSNNPLLENIQIEESFNYKDTPSLKINFKENYFSSNVNINKNATVGFNSEVMSGDFQKETVDISLGDLKYKFIQNKLLLKSQDTQSNPKYN